MLKQKILKTLIIVFSVSIAAVAADYVGSVVILHKPQVYDGFKTLFIALVISIPVGYHLVSQRLDLQHIREQLLGSIRLKETTQAEAALAHEKLRESEARYRMLTDNANDIIVRYDVHGVLEYASPSVRQLGYEPADLVGRNANDLIHPEDQWLGDLIGTALKEGRAPPTGGDNEQRLRCANGEWVWLQANPSPIVDDAGRAVGAVSVLRDVTARHQIEDELRAKQAEADAANQAKSDFLATMSHEIRTPLNGVLGMVQAMERDPLPPVQYERLQLIGQSGQALLTILNDILDLSKIEAGKLDIEETDFNLTSVVDGACNTFQSIADDKGVELAVNIEPDARGAYRGDPVRVRQVLNNLISNALKFTAAGRVMVCVEAMSAGVRFTVTDTGIGIPPSQIARLFEKFEQADSTTTRRFGGTGLGLSICQQLCVAMGGEVRAESAVGEGSRFIVELPIARVGDEKAETGPASIPEPAFDERPLRILAAEDNPMNQVVLKTLLAQAGLDPVMVANGEEAVAAWTAQDWDLILMDVQMPVMDGVTATRLIRGREASEGRAFTPILALTANAMTHQLEAYQAAGMTGAVSKPINVGELFGAIAAAMQAHDSTAAASEVDELGVDQPKTSAL